MAGGKAETALVLGIQHHITLNENTLGILSVGDAAQRGRSGREGPAGPHGTFPRILPPGADFHVAPSGDRLRIPLDSLIRSMAVFRVARGFLYSYNASPPNRYPKTLMLFG